MMHTKLDSDQFMQTGHKSSVENDVRVEMG